MSQPKSNEELIEEIVESVRYVEFLHGVPVELPSQTKVTLRSGIRQALAQKDAEVAEAQSKALVPLCFLQAELTTLLLERNTYNREDKIQENLETIVATVEELREALTPPDQTGTNLTN